MFNVECYKVHDSLKFSRMLQNGGPCGFEFFWGGLPEKRTQFFLRRCDLHRNYGMVVILLSFLCNYDNLILKLHHEKRSHPVWCKAINKVIIVINSPIYK